MVVVTVHLSGSNDALDVVVEPNTDVIYRDGVCTLTPAGTGLNGLRIAATRVIIDAREMATEPVVTRQDVINAAYAKARDAGDDPMNARCRVLGQDPTITDVELRAASRAYYHYRHPRKGR